MGFWLSLLRLERKQNNYSNPLRIRIFLFLSHSFGTINTFIHSVVHSKTIPDSRPKWAKSRPVFRPKRPKNPTRWGGTYLYGLYKRTPPPTPDLLHWNFTCNHLTKAKCESNLFACYYTLSRAYITWSRAWGDFIACVAKFAIFIIIRCAILFLPCLFLGGFTMNALDPWIMDSDH